jgi:hypothetical protein
MFNLSKKAAALTKQLFGGNQVENKIAAGVMRTILSDITRLYFENKQVRGKGVLVFNPEEPEKSRFLTVGDLEDDLSVAQEAMNTQMTDMLKKVIKVVEKENESDVAIIAMIQLDGIAIHLLDSEEANKRIDEMSSGLIL